MSTPNGPSRRRRIAGEGAPTVTPPGTKRNIVPKPAKKKAADKAPAPKIAAKRAPVGKAPVVKEPARLVDTPVADTKRVRAESAPTTAKVPKVPFNRPSRTNLIGLAPFILVAVAALVFGVVFGVKGVKDYQADRGIGAASTKATSAAGTAAETIFTYQYNKLDAHLKESKKLMTPKFQKEFESIAPALSDLAPQRKIVVLSKVRNAAAVECGGNCSPDKASVLVFLDQARLVGDSTTPTVFGNRIVVDMVKSHGKWLVSNILAL